MRFVVLAIALCTIACDPGDDDSGSSHSARDATGDAAADSAVPDPASPDSGDSPDLAEPVLIAVLEGDWREGWVGSPAVADLDGDGVVEVLVARGDRLYGWHVADGARVFEASVAGDRIWAAPVVADLRPDRPGLEVAVAARDQIYLWDAQGAAFPEFPVAWRDELRAIAAGDIDGDGALELVVVSTTGVAAGGRRDVVMAYEVDGRPVRGFPPNTTGASGCDERCYVTGGFDQTLALGDVDGDGLADVLVPQDNAYVSLHRGDGEAFRSHAMFTHPTRFPGIRFLHDLRQAQQGWAEDEGAANQAHFTNSAPAIADLDGDGVSDLVILGSVQNAAQSDRLRGVALWAVHHDGTRLAGWEAPYHVPTYRAGLWDFDGTNVVAATNQVSVAELRGDSPGPELVFAGFDGAVHAVDASAALLWRYEFTTSDRVLTAGGAHAPMTRDGAAEVVFATYSPDPGQARLYFLDRQGRVLRDLPLPGRGSMAVPTIADADGDGTLDVVVSLKDAANDREQVLVFSVPGSRAGYQPWPTGRGNLRRDGTPAL
jgi:hypothetical protein